VSAAGRRWLGPALAPYGCASGHVDDLGYFAFLGVLFLVTGMMGDAVFGDQARRPDPPFIFSIDCRNQATPPGLLGHNWFLVLQDYLRRCSG